MRTKKLRDSAKTERKCSRLGSVVAPTCDALRAPAAERHGVALMTSPTSPRRVVASLLLISPNMAALLCFGFSARSTARRIAKLSFCRRDFGHGNKGLTCERRMLTTAAELAETQVGRYNLRLTKRQLGSVPVTVCWRQPRICHSSTHSQNYHLTHRSFHTTQCRRAEDEKIVMVPPFAESVSEGDVRWEKAVGDTVAEDDVVAEIETDKTSIPIPAPFGGVIEERFVEDGATVQPGVKLFKIRRSGAAPTAKPAKQKEEAAAAALPPPTPTAAPIPSAPPTPPPTPKAPISTIPVAAMTPTPAVHHIASPSPKAIDPSSRISGTRTEQRVKMNRMRQRIAQRLKDAQNTNAMLTTFNEIDMSNVMDLRKKHQDAFLKKHNIKIGFMSAFVKASAYALMDQPVVNAVIDGQDIVYRDYIDISVAVATPKGLVVPVLRNVEHMNYAEIEKGIMALGEKARTGTLAIEDMDGGTFTISNGGVFGSMFGTPIINPPQSAILGMHAIFERPVAITGKVEIRPMMYIALTYDHRLIDGREAVLFLRKVKSAVEDPRVILLDI